MAAPKHSKSTVLTYFLPVCRLDSLRHHYSGSQSDSKKSLVVDRQYYFTEAFSYSYPIFIKRKNCVARRASFFLMSIKLNFYEYISISNLTQTLP